MNTEQQDSGRVYTKSTPLIIEEWHKFKGKKEGSYTNSNRKYFSNFDGAGNTGYFSSDPEGMTKETYDDWDAVEVPEQEFLDIVLERPTKSKDDGNEPKDMVNSPSHYTSGEIECIDAIKASMSKEAYRGFLKGQILKYSWRYENKFNPLEDIKKLLWYSNKLKEELEDEGQ